MTKRFDLRDLILLAGALITVAGLDRIWRPVALIAAGLALIWYALYGMENK